jgi:hypothetical protein
MQERRNNIKVQNRYGITNVWTVVCIKLFSFSYSGKMIPKC